MTLPLEKQCCSLESARRLKELGFSQESLFYHCVRKQPDGRQIRRRTRGIKFYSGQYISAYTVAELGELLPKGFWHISKGDRFHITCVNSSEQAMSGLNEAECRALMLIYLAYNKLIEVKP